jgi:ligand-binding sensor domain-containing protein
VSNETGADFMHFHYAAQVNMYPSRTKILSTENIQSLYLGALAARDGNDAYEDGIIESHSNHFTAAASAKAFGTRSVSSRGQYQLVSCLSLSITNGGSEGRVIVWVGRDQCTRTRKRIGPNPE